MASTIGIDLCRHDCVDVAALSVAQLMARSGLAVSHTVPDTQDHDWRITDRCKICFGPVFTLRRGTDYARQTEHTKACGK